MHNKEPNDISTSFQIKIKAMIPEYFNGKKLVQLIRCNRINKYDQVIWALESGCPYWHTGIKILLDALLVSKNELLKPSEVSA